MQNISIALPEVLQTNVKKYWDRFRFTISRVRKKGLSYLS